MLAKDYMQEGETVQELVMRVLRDQVLTEENTDDIIALLHIKGIFGGIIRGALDSLMPERLLHAIEMLLAKAFPN